MHTDSIEEDTSQLLIKLKENTFLITGTDEVTRTLILALWVRTDGRFTMQSITVPRETSPGEYESLGTDEYSVLYIDHYRHEEDANLRFLERTKWLLNRVGVVQVVPEPPPLVDTLATPPEDGDWDL